MPSPQAAGNDFTTVLLRVAHAMAQLDDAEKVLGLLSETIVTTLGCDRSTTVLVSPTDGAVTLGSSYGLPRVPEAIYATDAYRAAITPIVEWLIRERKPLIVDGPPFPPVLGRWLVDTLHIKSLLVIPLFDGERLLGGLTAHHTTKAVPFPDPVIAFVEGLAMHAVVALRRAALNEELRRSEERYRVLVEHARDIIFTLDLDGRFRFLNPSIKTVLGYDPDALIGKHFSTVLQPESASAAQARFDTALRGETVAPSTEYDGVSATGQIVRLEVTMGDLTGPEGLVGRHGIARDVSETLKLLRASERERGRTRRMLRRERRQRERAETLLQVLTAASSTLSLKKVLIQVCGAVARLSVAERCSIWLYDDMEDELTPLMSIGVTDPALFEKFKQVGGRPEAAEAQQLLKAIQTQGPYIETRVTGASVIPAFWAEVFGIKSIAVYPMSAHGRLVGMMSVDSPKRYVKFPREEIETVTAIARQAAVTIENTRLFERVQLQAETDFLTGLPNHRRLQVLFQDVAATAAAAGGVFSVAIADVDHFKLLNDVHGHQLGDEALRKVALAMKGALGPANLVGRYGGDEFLFLFPGLQREAAAEIMEGVQDAVSALALRSEKANAPIPLRISFGVAGFPRDGTTWLSLLAAADGELIDRRVRARGSTQRTLTARDVRDLHPETLMLAESMLRVIDAKDSYTGEHSKQHAALSLVLADELKLPERERYALWLGGLLHDVGKIGIPDDVLCKPGPLTDSEWDVMRQHVTMSENIVRGLFDLDEAVQAVGSHHERWDGNGYPRGLEGTEIPRLGRMLAVVDAYSAMVHDRPYRKGMSHAEAMQELLRHAGTQFDPEMVAVFLRALGQRQDEAA